MQNRQKRSAMRFRSLRGLFGYARPSEQPAAVLAAIVTSSSDAIVSKTLDGTVTSWNAAAVRLFGYTEQEMIGQSTARLFQPGREHEERLILARIAAGERIDPYDTIRIHKNGELLGVSISASPVADEKGRII